LVVGSNHYRELVMTLRVKLNVYERKT